MTISKRSRWAKYGFTVMQREHTTICLLGCDTMDQGFSIRTRLILGFGIILLSFCCISGLTYWSLKEIRSTVKSLYQKEFLDVLAISSIRTTQDIIQANLQTMLLPNSSALSHKEYQVYTRKNMDTVQQLIEAKQTYPTELELLERYRIEGQKFREIVLNYLVPLIEKGKKTEAKEQFFSLLHQYDMKLRSILDTLVTMTNTQAHMAVERAEENSKRLSFIWKLGCSLALIFSIAMGGGLIVNLRKVSSKITEALNVLVVSGNEINTATTQLTDGAGDNAQSVDVTMKAIESVKQMYETVAEKSKYVLEQAESTMQISENGQQSMDEAMDAMYRIQEQVEDITQSIDSLSVQSQDVGEIITRVNALAKQSDLLAVNASIEAAKVGTFGQGFALVAQEIKSLAAQSKHSTIQVRAILSEVQQAIKNVVSATLQGAQSVEEGISLSLQSRESIRFISESIAESAAVAQQIKSYAEQQIQSITQVVQAMQNIQQVSDKNVESVKRIEVTTKELNKLGQKLQYLAGQY